MGSLSPVDSWSAPQQWQTSWDAPAPIVVDVKKKLAAKENSIQVLPNTEQLEANTFKNKEDASAWTTSWPLNASKKKSEEDKAAIKIEEEIARQNLYKTELCRSFVETGLCRYSHKCQFAHGIHELRPLVRHPKYKTEVCKNFTTTGQCPYGARCRFIHTGVPSSDSVWSDSWNIPEGDFVNPTTPTTKTTALSQADLVQDDDEEELDGSMRRLAIFQRIAT